MAIKEMLLKEHSKRNTDAIVTYIGSSKKKIDELVALFFNGEYRVIQRAAWVLSIVAINHPQLISKHLDALIHNLEKPDLHPAVPRNTFRLLQHIEIPENLKGKTVDLAFRYASSPESPAAIKAFAITVLGNISKQYPDLKTELEWLVKEQLPYAPPAIQSKARQLVKAGIIRL